MKRPTTHCRCTSSSLRRAAIGSLVSAFTLAVLTLGGCPTQSIPDGDTLSPLDLDETLLPSGAVNGGPGGQSPEDADGVLLPAGPLNGESPEDGQNVDESLPASGSQGDGSQAQSGDEGAGVDLSDVWFAVEVADGPGDLTVSAYAYTVSGDPLPQGTYAWSFDDEIDAGPMQTHAEVQHTFRVGGVHVVRLSLTALGLTMNIGCVSGSGGRTDHAQVTVWPTISGHVREASGDPVSGVSVAAEGQAGSATTDANGRYELAVPYGWTGKLTPSSAGRSFEPSYLHFANVTDDIAGADFAAADEGLAPPSQVTISGQVRTEASEGLAGVTLTASDGGGSTMTNGDGFYTLTVAVPWSGSVEPSLADHTFDPPYRAYELTALSADLSGQDYAGIPDTHSPVADAQSVQTDEDVPVSITLTGTDPDGDPLAFVIVTLPARGGLRDEGDGHAIQFVDLPYVLVSQGSTLTYTPNPDYNGSDGFSFYVTDGMAESGLAPVMIMVRDSNDPPTIDQACPLALVVVQDSQSSDPANRLELTAADPDAGAASLDWSLTESPAHGTVLISGSPSDPGGQVTIAYEPDSGFAGSDSFAIQVSDGAGGSDNCTVDVTVSSAGSESTPPVADAGPDQTVAPDAAVSLDGSASYDPDGTIVSYVWLEDGSEIASGVQPTIGPLALGVHTITLLVTDDDGDTDTDELVVTVQELGPGTTYYVSAADGDDSNPGTFDLPFATIQHGVDLCQPGDTVLVLPGTYAEMVTVTKTGAPSGWITIRSVSGTASDVIVTGESDSDPRRACFEVVGSSYVALKGLICERTGSYTIKVANSEHILLEQCVARYGEQRGILVGGTYGTFFATVRECTAHDNGWSGIFIAGSDDFAEDVLVERCVAYRNGAAHPAWAQGIVASWKPNAEYGHTQRVTIRQCVAYDNGMNIGFQDCIDSTIDQCVVWGNLPGSDGNGYKIGLQGWGSNCALMRSVAFGAKNMGIRISNSPGVKVYNNTVFDCGNAEGSGCGVMMDEGHYKNNCVFDNHYEIAGTYSYDWRSVHSFDESNHNLWKDSDGVTRDMPPNEGPNSIWGDPKLASKAGAYAAADAFAQGTITLDELFAAVATHLTPVSGAPVEDAGTDVGLPFSGLAPDMGAFEAP